MNCSAIILSRYNSSRLPGKALMMIEGRTVLQIIVERLRKVFANDAIIIATSTESTDDVIARHAQDINVNCYRGALADVSKRFCDAAQLLNSTYATRINGDNVFVDIELLEKMVDMASAFQYDFVSNVKGRTFPKGMSIEVVRSDYYRSVLPQISASDYHREHVTSWLYEHATERHKYIVNEALPEAAGIQMALDTPEDLERTKKIMSRFTADQWKYNLKEVLDIWKHIEDGSTI